MNEKDKEGENPFVCIAGSFLYSFLSLKTKSKTRIKRRTFATKTNLYNALNHFCD